MDPECWVRCLLIRPLVCLVGMEAPNWCLLPWIAFFCHDHATPCSTEEGISRASDTLGAELRRAPLALPAGDSSNHVRVGRSVHLVSRFLHLRFYEFLVRNALLGGPGARCFARVIIVAVAHA
jgi:hypothetical protein